MLVQEIDAWKRCGTTVPKPAAGRRCGRYPAFTLEGFLDEEVRMWATNDDAHEATGSFDDPRVIQCGRECTTLEACGRSSCLRAREAHHDLLLLSAGKLERLRKLSEARELPTDPWYRSRGRRLTPKRGADLFGFLLPSPLQLYPYFLARLRDREGIRKVVLTEERDAIDSKEHITAHEPGVLGCPAGHDLIDMTSFPADVEGEPHFLAKLLGRYGGLRSKCRAGADIEAS